jgi:lysophospholipase L1-like esterase
MVLHLVAALLTNSAVAMGPRPPAVKPRLMAILGDSIAAGTLADVPIPNAPTPEESVRKWNDQGVQADFIYTNKKTLSWGSGEKIQSHYLMLRDWRQSHGISAPLEVANLAVPGAETGDLLVQVKKLLEIMQSGNFESLEYVALTIGSNDACNFSSSAAVPDEILRRRLVEAFSTLTRGIRSMARIRVPIRVLLIGAPRIPNLGVPGFVEAPTLFGLSCGVVRDRILRYCRPLTVWNGLSDYHDRLAVVEHVNGILKSVALEMSGEFPDLQVVYSDRLYQLEIPLGALAADCFHPGRWAQEQIAKRTWEDQPWYQ